MAKKKRGSAVSSDALLGAADRFVLRLLKRAGGGDTTDDVSSSGAAGGPAQSPGAPTNRPLASLDEQVDVLAAITKYIAVKNKVAPDVEETEDFLSGARRLLTGEPTDGAAAATGGRSASKRRARTAANRASDPATADSTDIATRGGDVIQFGRRDADTPVSLPAGSADAPSAD